MAETTENPREKPKEIMKIGLITNKTESCENHDNPRNNGCGITLHEHRLAWHTLSVSCGGIGQI